MTHEKYIKKVLFIIALVIIFVAPHRILGQETLTLKKVLEAARQKSFTATDAEQQLDMAKQDYKVFQASLKPFLSLDGRIPGFFSSSSPITQPNGTIEFQRVTQNNASLSLFAQQNIPLTGARLFVQSDLQRFDDFTLNNSLYNGIPLRVGISQPIFGFNQIKWNKKVAPVQLKEAEMQYTFSLENTQFQTTFLYFQVLIAEEGRKIAELNTEVNEKLLSIANERLELGKISQDEQLQLEIGLDNSRLSLRRSQFELDAALRNLAVFIDPKAILRGRELEIPAAMDGVVVSEETAVRYALENRPEIITYRRQLLEAEQEIAQTKAETGPSANLFASFGLARGSMQLEEVYRDPFTEQQLNLTFSVPIVDWGRRKSSRKRAMIQLENTQASVDQGILEIENNTRLKVREFLMLQEAVTDQEAIRNLAEKRFGIANERYILGAISITDFTLAQREKDQTRRTYIQTLSDYWNSYYALRLLTGYDFDNNQKITY